MKMISLAETIECKYRSRIEAYRLNLADISEHAGIEGTVLAGGYGYRQILELVQNGADAIVEAVPPTENPRIVVLLRGDRLYVANTGAPLSVEGVAALLQSHSSTKRGDQIGRFGLGFKSLLGLGGKVDVLSSDGSLRFDPERCKHEIRAAFPELVDKPMPGLRLGWTIDRAVEAQTDPTLEELSWATTIVRAEVCGAEIGKHLKTEIQNFPLEFLLFLPSEVTLTLEDGADTRTVRRTSVRNEVVLHDGANESRWRIVEKRVAITDRAAKDDATHIHARETVPVAWAMPLHGGREEAGRFWAFFPTDTPTRLPGILNAPWKLNSDRKALIEGAWNSALMRAAGELIGENLPALATPDDPGRPLDGFPRQLERNDELAAPLAEAIWQRVATAPLIADLAGALRSGEGMYWPPTEDDGLLKNWSALKTNRANRETYPHFSCFQGARTSRLTELAKRLQKIVPMGLAKVKIADWFAEVADIEPESAKLVLNFLEQYRGKQTDWQWKRDWKSIRVIPTLDSRLATADEVVFAEAGINIPGRSSVHPALARDPDTKKILIEALGVEELDDTGWESILTDNFESTKALPADDACQEAFWQTLRSAPDGVAEKFIAKEHENIFVQRKNKAWCRFDEALLPGSIVCANDPIPSNIACLVDEDFHKQNALLITKIGSAASQSEISASGRWDKATRGHAHLNDWLYFADSDYRNERYGESMPQAGFLKPFSLSMPFGWPLLAELSGIPKARLTKSLLTTIDTDSLREVEFGHTTRRDAYPVKKLAHPACWYLRRNGTVEISGEAISLETLLWHDETCKGIVGWDGLAEPFRCLTNLVGAPQMEPPNQEQKNNFWIALFGQTATVDAIERDSLTELWAQATNAGQVPNAIATRAGQLPVAKVFVTLAANLARRAREQGKAVVTLDSSASLALWLERGANDLATRFTPAWDECEHAVQIEIAVPELSSVLTDAAKPIARSFAAKSLRLVIDGQSSPVPCLFWAGALYIDVSQIHKLTRAGRLAKILDEVAAAGWLKGSLQEAKMEIADAELEKNRAHVASGESLRHRLLLAVGGSDAPLREAIGELAATHIPGTFDALDIAKLALALLGPSVLESLKSALEAAMLKPPTRWGTEEARAFVRAIGFPDNFAASPLAKRDAEELISGPIALPPLHDFQEEVRDGLKKLIERGEGRRRAVVCLPTGGGKTRVTVQAAVELILARERGKRSVLWVAQTDELCEQAVQAFRQVWINLGTQKKNLRIARFWGGNQNPTSADGEPLVVVATIQTLNSRIQSEGLEWLTSPGLVVIDECHHAITPSYTSLLSWLDAAAPRGGGAPKDEPPIIGLSATPFRGAADNEESARLAKRFDGHWLPTGQERLREDLTERGVLSTAERKPLASECCIPPPLLEKLEREANGNPIEFEKLLTELNNLLATDDGRNVLLVKTISDSKAKSILFFANSVKHAEEMAARLNVAGISAAAISGETNTSSRRYFLEKFQTGELKVICNHSVLTTGFDAPKTDMVLIARQVWSPVRYMQMVGRGLRGKENGGTERCEIVTVMDNLGRFGEKHPYHYCKDNFKGS